MSLPRLRHSIAALGALQAANYLIPLVTLPYLTRVLGVEAFGKYALVLAVMAYFVLLTDYGFSWSATRQIAANRDDHRVVSSIFSSTWSAQWLLALLSALMLVATVTAMPVLQEDATLYLVGFTLVIGNVFLPLWLLQGLERMREVAIIQVTGRIATLPPLFFLVKDSQDVVWAIALAGAGPALAGVLSLYWISHNRLVQWKKPDMFSALAALREGRPLFQSKISISLYTTLTPLVLGAISGTTAVGYFTLADRIRRAAQAMLEPISQAMYPRLSHLYIGDRCAAQSMIRRSAVIIIGISGASSLFVWVMADWLVLLLGGAEFSPAALVLRWLAPLPFIMGLSNILGVQIMLPSGLNRPFNGIVHAAAIFSLLIVLPLVYWKAAEGAAIATLLSETFVAIAMAAYLYKSGILKVGIIR